MLKRTPNRKSPTIDKERSDPVRGTPSDAAGSPPEEQLPDFDLEASVKRNMRRFPKVLAKLAE
jgi:hypothetical protein